MTPVTPNTAVSRDTPVTWTRVCVGGSAGCSGETGREVVLRVTEEPCAPTPQRGAEGLTSPRRGRPRRTWRAPGLAPDKGLRNFQGERLPGGAWRQRGGAERRAPHLRQTQSGVRRGRTWTPRRGAVREGREGSPCPGATDVRQQQLDIGPRIQAGGATRGCANGQQLEVPRGVSRSPHVHTGAPSKTQTPPTGHQPWAICCSQGSLRADDGGTSGETRPSLPPSPPSCRSQCAGQETQCAGQAAESAQRDRPARHPAELLGPARPQLPKWETLLPDSLRFIMINRAGFFNKCKMRLYVNCLRIMPIKAIPPAYALA